MTAQKNKSLWLRRKPDERREKGLICAASAGIFCSLMLLAAAELTALPASALPMVLCGAAVCAFYGVLKYFDRQRLFYPVLLTLLVLTVIFFRESLANGMGLAWNALAHERTAATGRMLVRLQTSGTAGTMALLPFSLLTGSVTALLCCALSGKNRPLLAVLLTGMVLTGMAFFRRDAGFAYLIPALAAAAAMLIVEGSTGHGRYRTLLICVLTAAAVIPAVLSLAQLPAVKAWAAQVRGRVQTSVHTRLYETEYSTLPEGDFSDFTEEEDAAHPALAVTMETPEPLYLRGFTGATFADDRWLEIEPAVLAENAELLSWLNAHEFRLQSQFAAAAAGMEAEVNQIIVQNVGACSRYRYIPFSVCADSAMDTENLSPDSVPAHGQRVDSYQVVARSAEQVQPVLEMLQAGSDEQTLRYRSAESAYRDFIYEHYLQIPQEAMTVLQPHWDRAAQRYAVLNPQTAQRCVLEFLELCFPEEGKTSIDLPLSQASGTDYQYATVAVLTLRYFGIPARYAEGYVITEAMAKQAEAGAAIQVDSRCAGAWAEVYQDGIGWIPMAITQGPERQSEGEADENAETTTTGRTDLKEGEELKKTPEMPVQEEKTEGGYMVTIRKAFRLGALLIVPALILLPVLCVLRRKLLLKKRMELFCQEDRKLATTLIFSHCALLLEKLGYRRGTASMEVLYEPVSRDLGPEYGEKLRSMNILNGCAMFSSHPVEPDQWEAMLAFYETTLRHMNERISLSRKLWLKWVLCLL